MSTIKITTELTPIHPVISAMDGRDSAALLTIIAPQKVTGTLPALDLVIVLDSARSMSKVARRFIELTLPQLANRLGADATLSLFLSSREDQFPIPAAGWEALQGAWASLQDRPERAPTMLEATRRAHETLATRRAAGRRACCLLITDGKDLHRQSQVKALNDTMSAARLDGASTSLLFIQTQQWGRSCGALRLSLSGQIREIDCNLTEQTLDELLGLLEIYDRPVALRDVAVELTWSGSARLNPTIGCFSERWRRGDLQSGVIKLPLIFEGERYHLGLRWGLPPSEEGAVFTLGGRVIIPGQAPTSVETIQVVSSAARRRRFRSEAGIAVGTELVRPLVKAAIESAAEAQRYGDHLRAALSVSRVRSAIRSWGLSGNGEVENLSNTLAPFMEPLTTLRPGRKQRHLGRPAPSKDQNHMRSWEGLHPRPWHELPRTLTQDGLTRYTHYLHQGDIFKVSPELADVVIVWGAGGLCRMNRSLTEFAAQCPDLGGRRALIGRWRAPQVSALRLVRSVGRLRWLVFFQNPRDVQGVPDERVGPLMRAALDALPRGVESVALTGLPLAPRGSQWAPKAQDEALTRRANLQLEAVDDWACAQMSAGLKQVHWVSWCDTFPRLLDRVQGPL